MSSFPFGSSGTSIDFVYYNGTMTEEALEGLLKRANRVPAPSEVHEALS
jgi:hypothetical protein